MPRNQKRRPRTPAAVGYTLIELLVVLVLIGAAAALVIPASTRAFTSFELRLTAQSLAKLFQQARSRALFEGRTYRVLFAQAEKPGRKLMLIREDGKQVNQITLPVGVSLTGRRGNGVWTGDLEPLHFFPNGTSEALQLDLRDARASHVQLELAPLTARIRVTQLYKGD
jgi:general secretion pathway protein H